MQRWRRTLHVARETAQRKGSQVAGEASLGESSGSQVPGLGSLGDRKRRFAPRLLLAGLPRPFGMLRIFGFARGKFFPALPQPGRIARRLLNDDHDLHIVSGAAGGRSHENAIRAGGRRNRLDGRRRRSG